MSFLRLFGAIAVATAAAVAQPAGRNTALGGDRPGTATEAVPSFELDVLPILTARGCNQGTCHGKARGQNGFQLSLLAFDPEFDYQALTQQARGRRVFPAAPEHSLVLLKASTKLPHGGGLRLETSSDDYRTLLHWIEQGAPRRTENEPELTGVSVIPAQQFLKPNENVQLSVTATYSDGSTRDVTARTQYQSSEAGIVGVDATGLVKAGPIPGEATIMARYMNRIATTSVAIPLAGDVPKEFYAGLPRNNFIDGLAWAKLKSLNITPSPPVGDAKFLRRVHIDIIGRLPTPDEVRGFLTDGDPNKRARVVDELLERPEYADHWAAKWADLLRPNPYRVGIKAVLNYDAWIRDSFRQNKPYDQFVRELVTAKGSSWDNGAAVLFRDRREPAEMTTLVSQLFLGIRLECARCHHHPFEKWSQDDFYSLAAYFARVGFKGNGISPPISGGEETVLVKKTGSVEHPLSGKSLTPRPLFGEAPQIEADADPRKALAAWMTDDDNPFFAQVIANRIWAELMGRGLVEPIDDLRATNPPTNAALLDALAGELRKHRYNLKELVRAICTSHVYSLSSLPGERNSGDRQNYSRHYRTRLRAEVLADAFADIAGVSEQLRGTPANSRASEIWTTRVESVFLDTFGRPNRNQDPPCERTSDATVTQTLHLMNSPQLHSRVTADSARAARLAASDLSPERIVEELYLLVYSRLPDDAEREIARQHFAEENMTRRQATEDLMWALLNTPEFMFKD
ncbi:MAG: DUF1549 domain-containing protein [Planctomycetaceae bacterium]|nr:DUF1549 domain-containing protein [Planctomycetaceae bacterium]